MKRRMLLVTAMLLGLIMSTVGASYADGIIIPDPPPHIPITDVPSLTIKYHRVRVTIENQVAITHVDQVFVNEAPYEMEGTYIFPLPEEAAISEFSLWVDGEKLEGQILDKDKARRIYEDIVRRRKDPALLEYVGRNAFQARIFPIPSHGERRVELEYSQVLSMDGGLVKYVYPLDTERFSARPLEEVAISVEVHSNEPLKAIYSASHQVAVDRRGEYNVTVGYEEYDVVPDRDFELFYTISDEDFGLNLLSYREPGEDGFFLLLLAPKVEVKERELVAKDVILVLDTSGSMRGEKLDQAKGALEFVLDNLNDEDRFNIVTFSTGVRQYATRLQPAEERNEALDFVRGLEAVGGTDINRALLEALAQVGDERPALIIFLTDGLATEGVVDTDQIIANVTQAATKAVRIFTFGVGDEVNTVLLDTLAQSHRGASAYVRPGQSIEEEVSAFYAKVSSPLLADLDLDFGEVHVEDTYPYPLPDLFAGSQLVLVGRYREGGFTTVTLKGELNGRPRSFAYGDIHFRDEGGESFIPRLWATRKIGHLLSQIRLHGESKELVDEIVSLSVRYGIITPYTSFLVEETEKALTDAGREIIVEKEVQVMATPAPAYGANAVEKSIAQESLRGADTVSAPTAAEVKHVGDKAFVLHDGVWTDTLYEPDRMETVKVGFGTDGYFDLLSARPEWGKYFALGQHVIVVLEGQAYEVTEGDYELPELPSTVPSPEPTPTVRSAEPTPTVAPASTEGQGKAICPGVALSAVLPLLGLAFAWRRR